MRILSRNNKTVDSYRMILLFVTIVILCALWIMLGKKIYNLRTLKSMALQISELGVIAIGMSLVILLGCIDLSLVANANLSGIIAALILNGELPLAANMPEGARIPLAIITALLLSVLCGLINGLLIAKVSAIPIVATISTMTLYQGIAMAITNGKTITGFPEGFNQFAEATVVGIPTIFIILMACLILVGLFLSKTVSGRKLYLLGENHTAARFSGIENENWILFTYAVAGLLAGISSLIMIVRANSAKVGFGETYSLQAILIAIMGGFTMGGGKGKITGIALALCCIQFLSTAFTAWRFSNFTNKLIWGVMLLALMSANVLYNKKANNRVE